MEMELEKFKERNSKKTGIIIFTVASILLLAGVFFFTSFASYVDIKSFNIISGNIPNIGEALYVYHLEDGTITTQASRVVELVLKEEDSTCTYGVIPKWENNQIILDKTNATNTSSQKIRCDLYMVRSNPAEETIQELAVLNPNIKVNESMNNQTGNCPTYDPTTKTVTITAGEDRASLICEAEDDYGKTYYFRGNVTNNYVSFAGFFWRIVRINGDGSMRLIYDGTTGYANIREGGSLEDGANRQIGTRNFNTDYTDNADVGYMYNSANQGSYADTFDVMNNKNAVSSNVKGNATTSGSIDYWYANNIDITIPSSTKKYSDFVSLDTIFCNDKNIAETTPVGYTTNGYGSHATAYRWYYGPWSAEGSQQPRFTCVNTQGTVDPKNDAFTVSNKGNGALTYPVALLTTDEAVTAGAYNETTSHYLRTGSLYLTMTPGHFDGANASVGAIYSPGFASDFSFVANARGVRPVLSLKPDVSFSLGDGTINNPFTVNLD